MFPLNSELRGLSGYLLSIASCGHFCEFSKLFCETIELLASTTSYELHNLIMYHLKTLFSFLGTIFSENANKQHENKDLCIL